MLIAPLTIYDEAGVPINSARLPGYFSGLFLSFAILAVQLIFLFISPLARYGEGLIHLAERSALLYLFIFAGALPLLFFWGSLMRARRKHHPAAKNVLVWLGLFFGGVTAFWLLFAAAFTALFGAYHSL